jgi:hypothetical protein
MTILSVFIQNSRSSEITTSISLGIMDLNNDLRKNLKGGYVTLKNWNP